MQHDKEKDSDIKSATTDHTELNLGLTRHTIHTKSKKTFTAHLQK